MKLHCTASFFIAFSVAFILLFEAIHLFEKVHHKDSDLEVSENTEAGTIRLIRTACKAFER